MSIQLLLSRVPFREFRTSQLSRCLLNLAHNPPSTPRAGGIPPHEPSCSCSGPHAQLPDTDDGEKKEANHAAEITVRVFFFCFLPFFRSDAGLFEIFRAPMSSC
ncbi:hypothetical protein M406DRAFT_104920 [Cryphonectria parasitica EP155]|uniref:Uncharacterized protein n=1 Tax=Cryphonectria parasitica (strain ATCC 38755 / EP155) TaxID=660469 RepID=A0A9P4XWE9_CRYP1|nr:uncharacterized protein M406DRAFT_104920 [Cryphonectria parasitica EP155]KAF3762086.1 hypothetical protein M406DRAFT_104920 [Cryphonectria parasitica EP155]